MKPKSVTCHVCKKTFGTVESLMQHVYSGTHKPRWWYSAISSRKSEISKHSDTTSQTPEMPKMPKILGRTEFKPTHIPIIEYEKKSKKKLGRKCITCQDKPAVEDNGGQCETCNPVAGRGGYSING